MLFFNFLTNPLQVFLIKTGETIGPVDVIIFLAAYLAVPYLLFGSLLWAGGLGFTAALVAGIVVYLFWLIGQSGPIFGSMLLVGLLSIAEYEPLPILHDMGMTQAMTVDSWLNQMSFSATVLAFASIYFATTWPLAGLRKAVIGK